MATYLDTKRSGARPRTTPTNPHTQLDQNAPAALQERVFSLARLLPGVVVGPSHVSVPGARISEEHEMVRAIDRNHKRIIGKTPEREVVTWCSDASVLSRYGVETVNYGPSSGPRDKEGEKVRIQTLVDITKIYALTAAELCGVSSR